jgi:hypothetical protein
LVCTRSYFRSFLLCSPFHVQSRGCQLSRECPLLRAAVHEERVRLKWIAHPRIVSGRCLPTFPPASTNTCSASGSMAWMTLRGHSLLSGMFVVRLARISLICPSLFPTLSEVSGACVTKTEQIKALTRMFVRLREAQRDQIPLRFARTLFPQGVQLA